MPELPEVTSRAREMQAALIGKTIQSIEIFQPKCLNITPDEFNHRLTGATIEAVSNRGKWIFVRTNQGWLLLNMGMGGEILLVDRDRMPAKVRLVFDFEDQTCLAVNFWWFGYAHFVGLDNLPQHEMTARLGPNVLDLSQDEFLTRVKGQRGQVKAFLLDQSRVAGIGNAYIHDILFLARLHPQRRIDSLSDEDIIRLHGAIYQGLQPGLDKAGAFYELTLHGEPGGFLMEDVLIGYREGQPCPVCGTAIQKIRTGSTSSFICPHCQI